MYSANDICDQTLSGGFCLLCFIVYTHTDIHAQYYRVRHSQHLFFMQLCTRSQAACKGLNPATLLQALSMSDSFCRSLRLICSLSHFNVAQDCLYYRGFFCFPFLYAPLLSPIPPFFIRCCIKNFV